MHAQTPHLLVSDPRALAVRSVDYCRAVPDAVAELRVNHARFDARGRLVEQRDPRLRALPQAPANQAAVHSLSGKVLGRDGVDNGWCCSLPGEAGQVVYQWDGRGSQRMVEYDELLRPAAVFEQLQAQPLRCSERLTYADGSAEQGRHNRCGRLVRHDDPAGTRHWAGFSLTGEASAETRHFLVATDWPDWPVDSDARDALLEPGEGASATWRHGTLGQVLEQTDAGGHRQSFHSNLSGELQQVRLQLAGQPVQTLLSQARYNAVGQMTQETFGNGASTRRTYREQDGRLLSLVSRRENGETLQDIHYGYDPAGNLTSLQDHAQPTRHFANQRIEARCEYRYDSLYQLIEATGWEAGAASKGPGTLDDPQARSNFRQTYRYDAGGNLLVLNHVGAQSHGRFLIADRRSNRCLEVIGGRPPSEADFLEGFDANGNLLELQPGRRLHWDVRNQLREVHPVAREGAGNDTECYLYDAAGQRVRKQHSTLVAGRNRQSEVRYLPGLEVRDTTATGEQLQVVTVQAGTCSVRVLHWVNGRPDEIAQDQQRYGLTDHLGSSALELDETATLISHEVFYPFGETAWSAGRSEVEAGYRTIRYSGKERDATGLYYYGARYYVPWLQRWLNPDPLGAVDGLSLYGFVLNSPMGFVDTHGLHAFPVGKLQSNDARKLVEDAQFAAARRVMRKSAPADLEVFNEWATSLVPTVDFQAIERFDNRLNNALYKGPSVVPGMEFIVKKMQTPEAPQREELAYRVSEKIGFHLVPPAKARAKSLVQLMVPNIRSAVPGERKLPAKAAYFYYLINEFDDNAGNQLWDEDGGVQLIDHEAAFSTRSNAVYNLSRIDLATVFDEQGWLRFKQISKAEWTEVLGGERSKIGKPEARAFLDRVDATKKAMQRKIDNGEMGFGQPRSLMQKVMGKKVA